MVYLDSCLVIYLIEGEADVRKMLQRSLRSLIRMSKISIADAKNTLTKLIHEAEQGTAVHITRRGKPVAVLLTCVTWSRHSTV